jgi:PilZ domain
MIDLERRLSPRLDLQIPLKLQARELLPTQRELATRTINVSDRGLLLKSPTSLMVGKKLMVKMRIPTDVFGRCASHGFGLGASWMAIEQQQARTALAKHMRRSGRAGGARR